MTRPDLDDWITGWRGPALAALVALIAGLPGLLMLPPLDRDESRHAQASAQMLESGDFVDIRFQDAPRWTQPVGAYWMQALAVAATSTVEARDIAPYRLPSLLGAMLAAAACAWAGAALFGRRAGFLAGAMLGTTFLLSTEAGIAKADALVCGVVTLAMAALARLYMAWRAGEDQARRHKLAFWLAVAAALLIKGPVALVAPVATLLALSAWDRDVRWMRRLGWGWGLPLTALIVGPWALAVTIATDGGFWREALAGGSAGGGAHESGRGFPGLYLLAAPILFFPATLMLPAALSAGWRRRAEPAVRFLICWLVPAWLLFELAPTKPAHYILPTFGALALLAAAALTEPICKASRRMGALLALAASGVIGLIILYGLTRFGASTAQTWASITLVMTVMAAAIGGFLLLNRAAVSGVLAALVFGVVGHAAMAGTLRQLDPLAIAPRLEGALEAADLHPRLGRTPGPVAIAGFHEPSFVFLTGRETQLTDAAGAARALSEGRPAIVEARDADAFRAAVAALGLTAPAVGEVRGHNYSTGEDVILTLYAPPGAGETRGLRR